ASQANPGGTIRVAVPIAAFTGSDAEDGAYTAGLSGRKVTLNPATNGTLYYNNVAVSSSQTYTNFDPALVTMDPTGAGAVTTSFTYSVFDAADKPAIPATITMPFATGITLSGNVFNDKNGDANSTGDTFTNAGGLNAVLTDASGNVIESGAVNGSGFYTFTKATSSSIYNVVLSTTSPAIGTKLITSSLPTSVSGDWVNTGVNPGGSTPTPGNKTGILAVTTPGSGNVINQNFGIERLPLSNTQSYNIATPTGNSFLALNGTGAAGSPGPLTGSDVEDQPASGSLSGKNIRIASLPTNGNELWYNGAKISFGADGSTPPSPSNPLTITNYNQSLLQLRFTGIGSTTTTFNYNYVDAAGNPSSAAASYTVSWLGVLPVSLVAFSAEEINGAGNVRWTVENEINTSNYVIERSVNGVDFNSRGTVAAFNNAALHSYLYKDALGDVTVATIYYRLRIQSNHATIKYSSIIKIQRNLVNKKAITVTTNPIIESSQLSITTDVNANATVRIYATNGQLVYSTERKVYSGINNIPLNSITTLNKGVYHISVIINGEKFSTKVIF
ncbi:MAG: T9SS type A sorting domain-containing protein, partial [Ferruginibacter sp.]|nr:T9SS type A sorting domain-containing protein [Ferruginibacter sp.]